MQHDHVALKGGGNDIVLGAYILRSPRKRKARGSILWYIEPCRCSDNRDQVIYAHACGYLPYQHPCHVDKRRLISHPDLIQHKAQHLTLPCRSLKVRIHEPETAVSYGLDSVQMVPACMVELI